MSTNLQLQILISTIVKIPEFFRKIQKFCKKILEFSKIPEFSKKIQEEKGKYTN